MYYVDFLSFYEVWECYWMPHISISFWWDESQTLIEKMGYFNCSSNSVNTQLISIIESFPDSWVIWLQNIFNRFSQKTNRFWDIFQKQCLEISKKKGNNGCCKCCIFQFRFDGMEARFYYVSLTPLFVRKLTVGKRKSKNRGTPHDFSMMFLCKTAEKIRLITSQVSCMCFCSPLKCIISVH